jgi:hypothetical protein
MKVIPEIHRAHEIRYLRYYHWVDISADGILVYGVPPSSSQFCGTDMMH